MMIFAAFLAILQCAVISAQTRKDINLSLHRADVISKILSGEKGIPNEEETREFLTGDLNELSYVITPPSVLIRSGVPVSFADLAMMPSGVRTLGLQHFVSRSTTSAPMRQGNMMVTRTTYYTEYSGVVAQVVNLEPGKYYVIKEEISSGGSREGRTVSFSVSEVTDPQTIEGTKSKVKQIITSYEDYKARIVTAGDYTDFLEWAKNHSLEGSYSSKDGKTQIRFEGSQFRAYHATSLTATTTFLYGTYHFDDKTIILLTDSIKTTTLAAIRSNPGKEETTTRKVAEALYYKFDGEVLEVLGKTGDILFPITGEFRKSIGDAAMSSSSPEKTSGNVTASGQASVDIAWRVEDGTLIVSGKGDVPGNPSWSSVIDRFTAAVIGDGIVSLGHHAFAMSKITSLVIGKDVKSLGGYALFNCKSLTRVELRSADPPKVGSFAFMRTPIEKATLIVPAGSKAAYEKSGDWKKFGTIEEQ